VIPAEQLVVLVHRGAEERERLGEGGAAGDDLGAALTEHVELLAGQVAFEGFAACAGFVLLTREEGFGRIGTVIALMVPYAIVVLVVWAILFAAWCLIGIPLGPGWPSDPPPAPSSRSGGGAARERGGGVLAADHRVQRGDPAVELQ